MATIDGARSNAKIGFFLGTFDPVHEGHLRIVELALELLDELVVVTGEGNPQKASRRPMFEVEERVALLRAVVPPRVRVEAYEGDVVRHVEKSGATHFVRGMRVPEDAAPSCRLGKEIAAVLPHVRTLVFLTTDDAEASSTAIRDALARGEARPPHCPEIVWERALRKRG